MLQNVLFRQIPHFQQIQTKKSYEVEQNGNDITTNKVELMSDLEI